MNLAQEKYVRFENSSSDKSLGYQGHTKNRGLQGFKAVVSSLVGSIQRGLEQSSRGIVSVRISQNVRLLTDGSKDKSTSGKRFIDPQGQFLQRWNKIFVLACVLSVSLDPLFFYVPVIDGKRRCLNIDKHLAITASILRSFTDIFYILHIIFQFHTGFIAPSTRVFGRGELITNHYAIAKRYLSTYFIVDILAILPLPQVVILVIIPKMDGPVSLTTKDMLKFVILCQYIPRFFRIYPLFNEVTRSSGLFAETAWAGAAINLFLYMLASHVVGAFWYLFSIERKDKCWRDACKGDCDIDYLYCRNGVGEHNSILIAACPLLEPEDIRKPTDFNFGIFLDALKSNVVEMENFPRKFLYCFWWGLRSLSSLGQNLKTSTFVGEILFAITISIVGLVLFSLLIGNMQKYLQSITIREEEMRVKRRDAELWMSHRMLPESLRERIKRYEQYKWQETRGVDEEFLIRDLPNDVRRDINRHLCLALLTRVPMFASMDEQLLDAMCDRLKPVLYTEKSYIVREGDPVDEMLFVMRGKILTMTTNGGRTGFFNSVNLKAGDFCGEELLTWALVPNSSSSLPISTRTVQAVSDVEAFALMAEDLKFVASQFRRLHSKQLQHTFSGDHGQLVLYKQHGDVIVRGSLRSLYVKMKTDFKMHWPERAEPHQALELPSMRPGLLPMPFEPCGAIVCLVRICPTMCLRYLFRSQVSLILVLKKVDNLYIYFHDPKKLIFSHFCRFVFSFLP
ncbi:cyclic nucleotide-gated ion channel 1-like isoform X1 [Apium graveolens]|uniref:cyclic nucleotide-gated ion channel 1-like isoform X1 n=1 Tax=Apium graveolens TaxID=4045 RepID=UPI003D79FA69